MTQETRRFNRRDLIKSAAMLAGVAAASPLVAACAPAATPTAAPAAPKAAEPTKAPAAAEPTKAPAAAATPAAKPTEAAKPAASGPRPLMQFWTPKHFIPAVNEYIHTSAAQVATAKGFDLEVQQHPWGDFNTKMAAAVEAKTLPDAMIGVNAKRDYDRKILVDLSDVYKKVDTDGAGFFPVVKDGVTIKGKQWALGTHIEPQCMYYRTSKLKEAGFAKAPQTTDEFLKFAKATTDPAKSMWGFAQPISDCPDGNNFFYMVMWAFGSTMQTAEGKVNVLTAEFEQAVQWYTDLYKKEKVIPQGATAWDDTGNNKAWLGGQAASIFNSGSIINTMMTDAQYKDLLADSTFAPFPLKDKLGVTMGNFNAFGVMTSSKNQDFAKEIVVHAMSKERYLGYMKAAQGMFFPAIQREKDDAFYTKDPVLSQVMNLAPYARQNHTPGEMNSWMAELGDTWSISRMLAPVATGQKSVKDAVAEFAKRAETLKAKWDKVSG